ncbi:inactive protein tyrosine kinase pTKL-like [Thunnus thynnus]|uniref:inactive protein tyrosine kinase pTKL-like n=1 Tax=Thunnus thynnus TaxID=8237 RepID=UPI0035274072
MSDCEEAHFFWESWTSPVKRKRKKESKKNNKGQKRKNNITMKTTESVQKKKKKKKNPKFKEAMERKKDKKKEKKKKKKLSLDLDDSFVSICGSSATVPTAQAKSEASNLRSSTEKLNSDQLTQDSKKKTKRKKKVMFDLSPGYIQAKRPKFVSSSPQSPSESILSGNEAVRDGERCSQVSESGQSQDQPHDNDSQCSGDNMNSQDLFITQKTFRGSPSYASSGEASDKAVITTPQMFTQRDMELSEGSHKANRNPIKEKWPFQTWKELNLTEEKDVSCPSHVRPNVVNPYLDKPIVVNTSLDVAKSKKHSCTSSQQAFSCLPYTHEPSLLPLISTASTSTQTENLFTTELSSYLNFCQKSKSTVSSKDLKPLDLSLPQRVRKDLCSCLSVKMSVTELKDDEEKCGDKKPSCLLKDHGAWLSCSSEVRKEPCGPQLRSARAKSKAEPTPSPQSESELKSADTTTSSEDNEPPCRSSKMDLTQVRAVQMRLNESFFFKTKGEGQSPRPESPLMKLAKGRNMKSRKGHCGYMKICGQ